MTLLDKARACKVGGGRPPSEVVTREHVELAVAWVRGEIRTSQLAAALGTASMSSARSVVMAYLREGVRAGMVTIAMEADDATSSR